MQSVAISPQEHTELLSAFSDFRMCHYSTKESDLSYVGITSLKVLRPNNCKNLVELPANTGGLERLEYLDIHGSGINGIPSEIKKLKLLKHLWISFGNGNDAQDMSFNYDMISKLSKLEELVIDFAKIEQWTNEVAENIMKEVAKLKNFERLRVSFLGKIVDVIDVGPPETFCITARDLRSYTQGSSWKEARIITSFQFEEKDKEELQELCRFRSDDEFIMEVVDKFKMKLAPNHPRVSYHKDEGSVNAKTVEPPKYITPNGEFKRNIKDWQKVKFLGSGCFGAVYEVLNGDGSFFAVKEVSLLDQGPRGMQCISQLEQEISLLSQFEHENIVQYIGREKFIELNMGDGSNNISQFLSIATLLNESVSCAKDDSKLYIFLELATKGSLLNLYQTCNLGDSQVSVYTRQILNGLKYLHCRNVVHRDIKCANILVDASGSVKLADFGLAKVTILNDLKSSKGTPFWMAPEVINQKNQGYGLPADVWSLGCTVLEMLTGEFPYSPLEGVAALFRIGWGKLPDIPTSLSINARDFICKCLKVNPDDRPTAAQLLNHPFVKLSSSLSPPSAYCNGKRKQAFNRLVSRDARD